MEGRQSGGVGGEQQVLIEGLKRRDHIVMNEGGEEQAVALLAKLVVRRPVRVRRAAGGAHAGPAARLEAGKELDVACE